MVLADREALVPGDSCYAQLRFEEQALVYPGDHFILRSVTPVTTIGGGRVIDPRPRKHGTDPRWRERLRVLEEGPADAIVALLLEEAFPAGLAPARRWSEPLPLALRRRGAAVAGALADGRALGGHARRRPVPRTLACWLWRSRPWTRCAPGPSADPVNPYLSVGDLRREVAGGKEWPALDAALERLQEAGEVVRTEHGLRWAEAAAALEGAGRRGAAESELLNGSSRPGLEAPPVAGAAGLPRGPQREGGPPSDPAPWSARAGWSRWARTSTTPPSTLDGAHGPHRRGDGARGQITLAEVRDLLGTSRKYAQALLEHMDSEGLTLRVGDARRLRRRRR